MDLEMRFEPGGGGFGLVCPRGDARPGDDRMAAEQQRRVLDEHGVGIVGKVGQPDDLEAGVDQRLLIGRVLRGGFGIVDRGASRCVSAHSGSLGLTALVNARAISGRRCE